MAVGNVVIRQRGTKYVPGKNVRLGKDDTIYALRTGTVNFQKKRIRNFTGQLKLKTIVNVV